MTGVEVCHAPMRTHLIGAAAAVELAVEELVVPNFSCRRRTSRGGLATEFTNAIFTVRPKGEGQDNNQLTFIYYSNQQPKCTEHTIWMRSGFKQNH